MREYYVAAPCDMECGHAHKTFEAAVRCAEQIKKSVRKALAEGRTINATTDSVIAGDYDPAMWVYKVTY